MVEGNKSTRDAFGEVLLELGNINDRVMVVDCDLREPTRTKKFGEEFPERAIQCGISEANGIGIAAGLALEGYRPFISSFSHFITGKYLEITQSIAYNQAGVIIVGTHAGLAIGKDGPTQMGLRDTGIMRLLHGMRIVQPVDWEETVQAVKYLANQSFPAYLRLGRQPVPNLNSGDYNFEFGKGVVLRDGEKSDSISLFATGGVVSTTLEAAEVLGGEGISTNVINMHTLNPIDEEIILRYAKESKGIFAVDDHYIKGGLGSIVSEVTAAKGIPVPVYSWGVTDFGQSGSPEDLYRRYKLDKEGLVKKIKEFYSEL